LVVTAVLAASFLAPQRPTQLSLTSFCYSYCPAPTVTSVAPGAGPTFGGTSVTIMGTGFTDGTATVLFGSTPAAHVTVVSATEIIAISPAHVAARVDVRVTTSGGGTSAISFGDGFRFVSGYCALIDMNRAPTVWVKGQTQSFVVPILNCGTATWPHEGYKRVDANMHFTTKPGGSIDYGDWLTSYFKDLRYDVVPNTEILVKFTIKPKYSGRMWLEGLMVKVRTFWFDQVTHHPYQYVYVRVNVLRSS
jgi:hypothetical protein